MKNSPYFWPSRRIDTDKLNRGDVVTLLPVGLDAQGRYPTRPMPAEAATEVGADDREDQGFGIVVGVVAGLTIWGVLAAVVIATWGP